MIVGKRVRLRAIDRVDIPRFVEWVNDPEVTAGLLIYHPMSMAHEERWYEHVLQQPVDEQPLTIDLHTSDGWKPIGNCGFHAINWKDRLTEVGIFIGDKRYWSQGYGTEAMQLLLKHGFENLNLNRIFLHVFENNPRAIRSYEKIGFVHEGRLRQDVYKNGKYLDVLVMSVLRSEWQDRQV